MFYRSFICTGLVLISLYAQAQLPQIELSFKPGYLKTVIDVQDWETNQNMEGLTASLGARYYFFNGIVSLGGFYERSVYNFKYFLEDDFGNFLEETDASVSLYGVELRLSTSVETSFRPYGFKRLGKLNLSAESNGIELSDDTGTSAFGIGAMIKLGDRAWLTFPEVGVYNINNDISFVQGKEVISVKTGISVVIGRKRFKI